jgi:hypothetical protein
MIVLNLMGFFDKNRFHNNELFYEYFLTRNICIKLGYINKYEPKFEKQLTFYRKYNPTKKTSQQIFHHMPHSSSKNSLFVESE